MNAIQVGYARVSTADQDLTAQRNALLRLGVPLTTEQGECGPVRSIYRTADRAIIPRMRLQILLLATAFLLLVTGTALVFVAFDSDSHSVSDTIRPFVIAMAPIWAAFGLAVWAATRRGFRRRDDE